MAVLTNEKYQQPHVVYGLCFSYILQIKSSCLRKYKRGSKNKIKHFFSFTNHIWNGFSKTISKNKTWTKKKISVLIKSKTKRKLFNHLWSYDECERSLN